MFLLVVPTGADAPSHVNSQLPTSNSHGPWKLAFGRWELLPARYPTTSIPIERAVPRTVLIAESSDVVFRSGIFCFAMSSTCFAVTVPTLLRFGSADPFARF